ncbi:MAG TPA: hypothetical protein VLW85_00380 [Myxococcales bacterium]|nr:hypothetical protein [Myxococcales bacterium]
MGEPTSIVPEGEPLRRAVRWLSERRQEGPDVRMASLLEQAAVRFDLTPLQQEFLRLWWVDAAPPDAPP